MSATIAQLNRLREEFERSLDELALMVREHRGIFGDIGVELLDLCESPNAKAFEMVQRFVDDVERGWYDFAKGNKIYRQVARKIRVAESQFRQLEIAERRAIEKWKEAMV